MVNPETIISLILRIKKQFDETKNNSKLCLRLVKRIEIVEQAIKGLENQEKSDNYQMGMEALIECLKQCEKFILKFEAKIPVITFAFAINNKEEFTKLYEELGSSMQLLQLGMTAQLLINKEQDRQDISEDSNVLVSLFERQANEIHEQREFSKCIIRSIRELTSIQIGQPIVDCYKYPDKFDHKFIIRFSELVDFKNFLGEGSLGKVYKGFWNDKDVAIKRVECSKNKMTRDEFEAEALIMSRLDSKYIVKFFGACFEKENESLIMEYMDNGSLASYLQKSGKNLSSTQRNQLMLEVANGLQYMHTHQNKISHNDLRSTNVLITKDGHAKLSDFGRSKTQQNTMIGVAHESKSTAWVAPEVWEYPKDSRSYTEKSDIYSLGVIYAEIIMGQLAPEQKTKDQLAFEIAKLPFSHRNLIQSCWLKETTNRPDLKSVINQLQEIIKHDEAREQFVKGNNFEKDGNDDHARECYEKSASLGYPRAIGSLGIFAANGKGKMPKDLEQAVRFFTQAAEGGHVRSQYNTGYAFMYGKGVSKNEEQARLWLSKAAANGDNGSNKLLAELNKARNI